jgi:hypothetical protein
VSALTLKIACNRSVILISSDDCSGATCTLHLAMLPSCAKKVEQMWKTDPGALADLSVKDVEAGQIIVSSPIKNIAIGISIGIAISLLLGTVIWCCKARRIPFFLKNFYYRHEFFASRPRGSSSSQFSINRQQASNNEDERSLIGNDQL